MFMLASILILAIFTTYPSEHHCCHCHLVTCHAVAVLWYVCSFASLYSCVIEMLQIIYIHVYNRLYDYIYIYLCLITNTFVYEYIHIDLTLFPLLNILDQRIFAKKMPGRRSLAKLHLGCTLVVSNNNKRRRRFSTHDSGSTTSGQGFPGNCLPKNVQLTGRCGTNMMVFKLRVLVTWLDVDLRFLYGMSQHLQSFGILE